MDNRQSTQNKRDLRLAQMRAGVEPNGHKGNVTAVVLDYLMQFKWNDLLNCGTTSDFLTAMRDTLGKRGFDYWFDDIMRYRQEGESDWSKTEEHHGAYYIIAER